MFRTLSPLRGVVLLCGLALASAGLTVPLVSPAAAASNTVLIERDSTSKRVEFVRVAGKGADLNPSLTGRSKSSSADKAEDWLTQQAGLFGVSPDELVLARNETSDAGRTLTYTQEHHGVPVFGAALKANLDASGALTSVNGHVVPGLDLDTTPRVSEAKATAAAIRTVRQDPPVSEDGEKASLEGAEAKATLVIYETGSTLGQSGIPYLAWQVEVTAGQTVREQVILGAHKLNVLNRWSDGHMALNRQLGTVSNPGSIEDPDDDDISLLWGEGQPTGSLTQPQKNLIATAGDAYWMFQDTFGRDSFNNAGGSMISVDNRRDGCPNASWNGQFATFCAGMEADDIVAHEWGHAYTEYTSGLIYQWQAGALNESYSDVWGETVDLLNQREDEGETTISVPRPDSSCTSNSLGATFASVTIAEPASIAGPCVGSAKASTGPFLPQEPQTVRVVVGLDAADGAGPSTMDGCSTLTNAAAISGNWAYVDRGACSFATKAESIAAAGGLGMLVSSGSVATAPFPSTGNGTLTQIMVPEASGIAIKSVLSTTPIMVTLSGDAPGGIDAYRWLIGEKATALPGAMRDMWNPNCNGDPAKVSDAEYKCETDDNGGVHSNSGVPNRAYSLAADGGTFNNQTVAGLGLDKAAQIWWRAGASYLTPTSDFNDFASSLAQSCTTLVGQPIRKVGLAPGTPGAAATKVTSADCGQLNKVIDATELRSDPVVRCAATPRFTSGEPTGCGAGTTKVTVLRQDFEKGLAGWTSTVTPAGGATDPGPSSWVTTAHLPNRAGSAARVANPDGTCQDSLAGVSSLTSPEFTVNTGLSPRLTFTHAASLEPDYDGANVKLSINGGEFEPVPTAAYTKNAPDGTILDWDSPGSDNPMLGETAWTGFEAHTGGGRWGTSQIDLATAGVDAGDKVKIRFDLGTDVCGGAGGWYVDDVSVTYCAVTTAVAAPNPRSWTAGGTGRVTAKVTAAHGSTPTGTVALRTANGAILSTAKLSGGSASLTVPKTVKAGSHQLTVAYLGTAQHAPSERKVTATVKATSRTTVSVSPSKPRRGKAFTVLATVRSSPGATGKVRFTLNGRTVGTATIKGGRATLKISAKKAKKLKVSSKQNNSVRASYAGSAKVAASSSTKKVRGRR